MDNELFITLLSQHNRLIIPSFGTFLKKEQGGTQVVVFTPFLKNDDGVLREAISHQLDVSNEESAQIISQYVEELKSRLEKSGRYYIKDLGTLKHDVNGALTFIYEPKAAAPATIIAPSVKPIVVEQPPIIESPRPTPQPIQPQVVQPRPIQRPTPVNRPLVAPNPQRNPMPVRPQSPTAAPTPRPVNRRVVGAPTPAGRPRPSTQRATQKSTMSQIKNLPKTDIWLLIAIVATVLVVLLIIYAYINSDPEIILNPVYEESVDTIMQVVN